MKYKHVFNISVTVESDDKDPDMILNHQIGSALLEKVQDYLDFDGVIDKQHVVTVLQGDQLMGDN